MEKFNYKHVFVIGVDGAGTYVKNANMPNLFSLFEKGAFTYNCLTTLPTISAQCWGSLLIGVDAKVHGLSNGICKTEHYANSDVHPTYFRLVREAFPDAKLGAFCNWTPIYNGIIEHNIGVVTEKGHDYQLSPKIAEYIKTEKPTLLFVHFDGVDGSGHNDGYGTEGYYNELNNVDNFIGEAWNAVVEAGIEDDTLFISVADHGGSGHDHGGPSNEEKWVYFTAVGKTVAPLRNFHMRIRDIPAIVCCALGIDTHEGMDSFVPEGLFTDVSGMPIRPDLDAVV
ncbi:MAG: alkaline phosphatase [Ruminococcaceae bacterium]|nr:alkaline phosphatase [Oscillospiraceae bacterium]